MNQPLRLVGPGRGLGRPGPFVQVEGPFVIDAIKGAEDDQGLVIRGHEALGQRATVRLFPGVDWTHAGRTNLLEDPTSEAVLGREPGANRCRRGSVYRDRNRRLRASRVSEAHKVRRVRLCKREASRG